MFTWRVRGGKDGEDSRVYDVQAFTSSDNSRWQELLVIKTITVILYRNLSVLMLWQFYYRHGRVEVMPDKRQVGYVVVFSEIFDFPVVITTWMLTLFTSGNLAIAVTPTRRERDITLCLQICFYEFQFNFERTFKKEQRGPSKVCKWLLLLMYSTEKYSHSKDVILPPWQSNLQEKKLTSSNFIRQNWFSVCTVYYNIMSGNMFLSQQDEDNFHIYIYTNHLIVRCCVRENDIKLITIDGS